MMQWISGCVCFTVLRILWIVRCMVQFHLLRDVIKDCCCGADDRRYIRQLVPEGSGELENIRGKFNDHKQNCAAGGNGQCVGQDAGAVQVALGSQHCLNPGQHAVGSELTQEYIGNAATNEGAADKGRDIEQPA